MTDLAAVKADVEAAWEDRDSLTPATHGLAREAVEHALDLLDSGRFRVAEKAARVGRTPWASIRAR